MSKRNFEKLTIMVDCSRNAIKTVDEMKRFITLMAKMGYNELDLYMEDTFTVEGEDFFGYMRGRYSPEELKEIDDFAYNLGIEVVPFIQTLGHLNQLFQWECYDEIRDCDRIFFAGEEKTYEFIEKMVAALRPCFRSKKINIGMDEAGSMGRGKYYDKHGAYNVADVFIDHVNRVCDIVRKYDFRPLVWGDMFFTIFTGKHGAGGHEHVDFNKEFLKKVPEDMTIICGNYSPTEKDYYLNMIRDYKQLTPNFGFIGASWKWTGWCPAGYTAIGATDAALKACIEEDIKYVIMSLWGDNGAECSDYSALPALVLASCYNQGIFDMDEIKAKCKEWTGVDFDTFLLLSDPDFDPELPLVRVITPTKYQFYNDCFMGLFDVGGVGPNEKEFYEKCAANIKAKLGETGEYRYIFETIMKLCEALSIKAQLGVRTHEAYLADNKEELKNIIADYKEAIKRVDEFYYTFRKQWYTENKPHGFDVQDIRIGAVLKRMQSCMERLQDYVDGKIDKIPELHEKQVPLMTRRDFFNNWAGNVTANVLHTIG